MIDEMSIWTVYVRNKGNDDFSERHIRSQSTSHKHLTPLIREAYGEVYKKDQATNSDITRS